MDSSSSALSRVICLLGENPEIQSQLRHELREAKNINNGQELDYDQIINLPFLDAVIRETLRLYAVSFFLTSTDIERMVQIPTIEYCDTNVSAQKNTCLMAGSSHFIAPAKTWFFRSLNRSRQLQVFIYLKSQYPMERRSSPQFMVPMRTPKYGEMMPTNGNRNAGWSQYQTQFWQLIYLVFIQICEPPSPSPCLRILWTWTHVEWHLLVVAALACEYIHLCFSHTLWSG